MSKHARKALFEVIKKQIADSTPPETEQTFRRLLSEGYDEQEAMRMLASVLLCEMRQTMIQGGHDDARYVGWLNRLPDMSFLEDE